MKKVFKKDSWGGVGFWERSGIGGNAIGDFNSDVDIAVAADGVSVFHIKQPHFVCIRMEEERERRIDVQHFHGKLPLNVLKETAKQRKKGLMLTTRKREKKEWCSGGQEVKQQRKALEEVSNDMMIERK